MVQFYSLLIIYSLISTPNPSAPLDTEAEDNTSQGRTADRYATRLIDTVSACPNINMGCLYWEPPSPPAKPPATPPTTLITLPCGQRQCRIIVLGVCYMFWVLLNDFFTQFEVSENVTVVNKPVHIYSYTFCTRGNYWSSIH
ncbi:hypothetical protein J6590_024723 [Homalodisca vitripennis]|nr:hypothetical protein J6590_024723 [Homalodisca vitripennis]